MKKLLITLSLVTMFFCCTAVSAGAVVNDTVKVGLRYGSEALFSANLENAVGQGYSFGYFDENRDFIEIGCTEETAISMTVGGTIYMDSTGTYSAAVPAGSYEELGAWHIEYGWYGTMGEAEHAADDTGGWPIWYDDGFAVRFGCYDSRSRAEIAMQELGISGEAVCSDPSGVLVTKTRTSDIIFEFAGSETAGVMPYNGRNESETWFKGYKYPGGFEYVPYNGKLQVINVVNLESYVKGVVPFEMSGNWPQAALEAQAVCARTYASQTRHSSSGFDICNTTHCQVYYGRGSGSRGPSSVSDLAVECTAGEVLCYDGTMVDSAVYHACDGGATENAENVWSSKIPYLQGKIDPYESQTTIPNYGYSVSYTAAQLTDILSQKGYNIGTVKNVYVSAFTPTGNVKSVTFEGSKGDKTFSGESCRTIFYSSTYSKSVRSMRFTINGGSAPNSTYFYINDATNKLQSLDGVSVISGSGSRTTLSGSGCTVLTASGKESIAAPQTAAASAPAKGTFLIEGTGSGHNVGMSQYGAKAMAELGYTYLDILQFYYTDITVE